MSDGIERREFRVACVTEVQVESCVQRTWRKEKWRTSGNVRPPFSTLPLFAFSSPSLPLNDNIRSFVCGSNRFNISSAAQTTTYYQWNPCSPRTDQGGPCEDSAVSRLVKKKAKKTKNTVSQTWRWLKTPILKKHWPRFSRSAICDLACVAHVLRRTNEELFPHSVRARIGARAKEWTRRGCWVSPQHTRDQTVLVHLLLRRGYLWRRPSYVLGRIAPLWIACRIRSRSFPNEENDGSEE